MNRRRTTPVHVTTDDSADTLLEIEAVIVVRATVRRAAVASLTVVGSRRARTITPRRRTAA